MDSYMLIQVLIYFGLVVLIVFIVVCFGLGLVFGYLIVGCIIGLWGL